jgi:tetratricopeptide (TPR) repeat protein
LTTNALEIGILVALINQDRLGEAEERARAMLKVEPEYGMLWKVLSVALLRQGKDAMIALQRTTELMPEDGEAHGNLGAALRDQGRWEEALTALHRALALQPDNVEALVDAADAMRSLGRRGEAIPLYQKALGLNPRLVEAQNNLGNAFLELGLFEDAAECYRRAHEVKPEDARVLCNLGSAQKGLGQREQAAASYTHALKLDPRSVEAHKNLADVLHELGARREAASLYARAVELDPNRADIQFGLATTLFELRRLDEAVASYRRVLALDPRHAAAHLSLGVALRAQRRPVEAQASCEAALSIDPDYVEALSLLAELRADRGQFMEAEALFRRSIEIDPEFAFAYSGIATHRKMTLDDAGWLGGATKLLEKPLPLEHAITLRYALGKYFDDVGRFDQAFGHYRMANELTKRRGSMYQKTKLEEHIKAIIRSFDGSGVRTMPTAAANSDRPVFVVGMPRSGTSLIEQILASHPDVFGAGEVSFWDAGFRAYRDAEVAEAAGDATVRAGLMTEMADEYLRRLTQGAGAALRVVDKMPANFMYLGLIHAAFPRARIIHVRRHPIDTCLSIYFQNFFNRDPYANDLVDLAHYYGEYIRITDHWRKVLPASALLDVPYEALIGDQEAWTRRVLEFIGLPWDPRCLEFHRTDRVVITASKWQVRQTISAASAGRWRNYAAYVAPLLHLMDLTPTPPTPTT